MGAQANPISSPALAPTGPAQIATTLETPLVKLPASTTNFTLSYPKVARGESVKLLESKVSLDVKNASFVTALDALLASANVVCNVECRGVGAMRLTLNLKDCTAAPLLDSLAKAGGARLWVFATKIVIAPPSFLTEDEVANAKLYGVLISKEALPPGTTWGQTEKGDLMLNVANTKVSGSIDKASWNATLADRETKSIWDEVMMTAAFKVLDFYSMQAVPPNDSFKGDTTVSASFSGTSFGDVFAFAAHTNGCELFLLPDRFLICHPDKIPTEFKDKAVAAFTPSSTHFNFDSIDPSAKAS